MVVLGLDIGTTATKGIAYNDEGTQLATARAEYPVLSSRPNYFELDPTAVCEEIAQVIGTIANEVGRGTIQAVASAALGEAIVPLDANGGFLYNTIVALDARAGEQMRTFSERIEPSRFFEITGQTVHPIVSLAKILWWRDKRPDVFKKARSFNCWNEMLCRILGVPPAISPSLAARTGLYDLRERNWSEPILAEAGIEPEQLGRIVPAGEVVDIVSAQMAEELGLSKSCAVVSGGWDQACVALGAGAIDAGTVVNSMGSTDSLNAAFSAVTTTPEMMASGLTCTPHAIEGLFCTVAYSLTGGNLLQWYRESLDGGKDSPDYFETLMRDALASERPVWVLPHFAGSGTPHLDPDSMGAMLGMAMSTKRSDIIRGLVDGVCLEMAQNLNRLTGAKLPVERVLAGSGGAKSPELLRLRSAALGLPITPLLDHELGCSACAMLALAVCDPAIPLVDRVRAWVREGETVQAPPELTEYYARKRELHERFYEVLQEVNHLLHEFPPTPSAIN